MYLKKLFCIRQKKSEGHSFCHSIIYITDRQRNRKLWVFMQILRRLRNESRFNLHDSKFKGFSSTFALIKKIMEKSVDVKLAIFVETMIKKRFSSFIYIRKSSLQENIRLSKLCTSTIPPKKLEKKNFTVMHDFKAFFGLFKKLKFSLRLACNNNLSLIIKKLIFNYVTWESDQLANF